MINRKNNDKNNDVTIAGTDFFADSESFLHELTDSELFQGKGANGVGASLDSGLSLLGCADSTLSLLNCN